ncbi:TetR/AcrR family transcriptional regulator [Roseivirga sp. BDSF3-8]|uniref:TetR/AcrR family transcriptional regulator n=1 Tax=Roseivirga sp. BDSF3-8 TaxID=3241598 RepID=UPI003531D133
MTNRLDRKKVILQGARELFYKNGFSQVSMDELARHLGMSKKTLYNYFDSKEVLLHTIIIELKNDLSAGVDRLLMDETLEFPDKIRQIFAFVGTKLSAFSQNFLLDLKRTSPQVWAMVEDYRREAAFLRFNRLLEQGINKGYIRKEVNKTLAVMLYAAAIETILNPEFRKLVPEQMEEEIPDKPAEVFDGLVSIILDGAMAR